MTHPYYNENQEWEECPCCDGEGTIEVEVSGGRWDRSVGGFYPDEVTKTCPKCHGYGEKEVEVEEFV